MSEQEVKQSSKNKLKEEEETGFRSGLTWRSMVALLYSLFVFSPAIIWLNLVTTRTTGEIETGYIPTAIITLLIFSEIAAMQNKPLTKQEAAIIFGPASAAGSAGFLILIYKAYLIRHPLVSVFGLDPSLIPTWFAPSYTSPVFDLRTFNHPDWIAPIMLIIVTWMLGMSGGLFFGLIGREIFIEAERLPFPMQQITAMTIESLTERRTDRMTVLSWAALFSFIYGIILYTIPTITTIARIPIRFIPIPWYDFTSVVEDEWSLPGGSFGIATDVIVLASGIVIPTPVVIGMFIGSFGRFFIGNWLLYSYGISEWAKRWVPGMSFTRIYQDSTLYFWLNPLIGVAFAIAIIPLIIRWKVMASSLKALLGLKGEVAKKHERISGPPVSKLWMFILFLSLPAAIAYDLYLVPDFPLWPLILYEIVFPFITLLSAGRSIAITGRGVGFPYINYLTIMISGYQKVDAWFLPLTLNPGTGWMQSMKVAQLTRTSITSWIKANVVAYPLALISGYLYMSLFWQMAPIPSELYPAPGIQWPINIMNHLVWITRPAKFFQPMTILYWFLGFGAFMAVSEFISLPVSTIGIATGLGVPIPIATTMLIGVMFKTVLSKILGKEWIREYTTTLAAGLGLGESLAIIIGVAISLAMKSVIPGMF